MQTSLDPAQACGIGASAIKGIDCGKLADYLMQKHAIHVRPRYVPSEFSAIRVTPNIYTTLEEIDTFSTAIEQVVEHGIS